MYPSQMGIVDVLPLCSAVVKVTDGGSYCVGCDTRRTSKILASAISSGILWSGGDVIDVGVVPTPVLAHATRNKGLKAGFAVTASHNPPEYAGVKIFNGEGMALPKEVEERVEAEAQKPEVKIGKGFGSIKRADVLSDYMDSILAALPKTNRSLKVLVDCAGGAGSLATPLIFKALGHKVISVNANPSYMFTARPLEPTSDNLSEIAKLVPRLGADFGIAHDGDADRVVLIDASGKVLPDYVFSALVLMIVTENRKGDVVISINSSNALERISDERGCKVVRTRLGKTFDELRRRNGVFATEPSKVVDPSWGLWEDGIYASALLVQKLASEERSLSSFVGEVPKYHYRQMNMSIEGLNAEKLRRKFVQLFKIGDHKEVQDIDGTRVVFKDDSWVLFRKSGTEPKVRFYAEALTEEKVDRIMNRILSLIDKSAINP